MDFQHMAEIAADIAKRDQHIRTMIGVHTVIVEIADPDKGINGKYQVVRTSDGVFHILHLEDGLYDSDFIIHRDALASLVEFLHVYLTLN